MFRRNIRSAVLAAKAGDIVGPMEHATGYYIFKVLTNGLRRPSTK